MKRLSVILMACLLVLGMSQCKKEKPNETNEESVSISLKVIADNAGTKVDVTPEESTAPVAFEEDDIIYVVSEGYYVGTLTCNSSGIFTGSVTGATEDKPLSFFFLGNKVPEEALVAGTTSSCTIDISDQTSELPVISFGTSTTDYTSGNTSFTCKLNNQCGLVKFNLATDIPAATPVSVTGMNNGITVNFGTHAFALGTAGDGSITLKAESATERWAILPIQGVVTTATAYATGYAASTNFTVPAVTANMYYTTGVSVPAMTAAATDPKAFTVNDSGKQVKFAPGNLRYNAGTWSFAPNQYDYLGSWTDEGLIDLFSFGSWTTSSGVDPYNYQSLGTNESDFTMTNNDLNGTIAGYANVNWYTLSQDEWIYVINRRHVTVNNEQKVLYGQANVMGINGLIILPDGWDGSVATNFVYGETDWANNTFDNSTTPSWSDLESAGVVFLPAAGFRVAGMTIVQYVRDFGFYRSSTPCSWTSTATPPLDQIYVSTEGYSAYYLLIHRDSSMGAPYVKTIDCYDWRSHGGSVRLVRDAN